MVFYNFAKGGGVYETQVATVPPLSLWMQR